MLHRHQNGTAYSIDEAALLIGALDYTLTCLVRDAHEHVCTLFMTRETAEGWMCPGEFGKGTFKKTD